MYIRGKRKSWTFVRRRLKKHFFQKIFLFANFLNFESFQTKKLKIGKIFCIQFFYIFSTLKRFALNTS